MMYLYQFAATTVSLIFACILGVSGVADGLSFHGDDIVVEMHDYTAFAFGGFVYNGYLASNPVQEQIQDMVTRHERGHLVQEELLGIFYLPIVALPSLISYWTGYAGHRSMPAEQWATDIGEGLNE